MRLSRFCSSSVVATLAVLLSLPAKAQARFAFSVKSPPVMRSLSFTQAAPTQSFPLSLTRGQVMNITDFSVSPSSATTDLWNSMKIYNAEGRVIQSGQSGQIAGGVNAENTPVRAEFTSNVKGTVSLSLRTRTIQKERTFNSGSSDSTKAATIRSKSFTLSGAVKAGMSSPPSANGGHGAGANVIYYKAHLRAGEAISLTSGQVSGPSRYKCAISLTGSNNTWPLWSA
jgi:hypothetical protein